MIVRHIIEDIELVFDSLPKSREFDVAFASYIEDGSGNIEFRLIESFHWDDDKEFFLVPNGCAKHYSLEPIKYSAQLFLDELKAKINKEVEDYCAYARARVKIAKDGSVASLNSPLWGTGYHEQEKLLYFYHGKQPSDAS